MEGKRHSSVPEMVRDLADDKTFADDFEGRMLVKHVAPDEILSAIFKVVLALAEKLTGEVPIVRLRHVEGGYETVAGAQISWKRREKEGAVKDME